MFTKETLYSYNDITIIPTARSFIESRSECDPYLLDMKLPLFTAPMSTVVNEDNFDIFEDNGINAILPRNIDIKTRLKYTQEGKWAAYSLKEFEENFCKYEMFHDTWRVLIDVANGHMSKLYELVTKAKKLHNNIEIMVGNIANPETYETCCHCGVDYVRVGIGAGSGCITSSNTAIHYPMASLVYNCWKVKQHINGTTKIIADGGIRNYSDVIKALALGADYVMIGSLLAQCLESAGQKFYDCDDDGLSTSYLPDISTLEYNDGNTWYSTHDISLNEDPIGTRIFPNLSVYFYGMASKRGQCDISGGKTKTSEGIAKSLPVIYTIEGWTENMIAYMRSAMSYCDIKFISDFNPLNVETCIMSNQTKNSISLVFNEEMSSKIDGEQLFIDACNISRMFRFQFKNKNLIIVLDTIKLEKHYLFYLLSLLNKIKEKESA